MANSTTPRSNTRSSRPDAARWKIVRPKGALMSDEEFGALERFPDVRRFRCSACGTRQFVLADARVTPGIKSQWACECTRAAGLPGH